MQVFALLMLKEGLRIKKSLQVILFIKYCENLQMLYKNLQSR